MSSLVFIGSLRNKGGESPVFFNENLSPVDDRSGVGNIGGLLEDGYEVGLRTLPTTMMKLYKKAKKSLFLGKDGKKIFFKYYTQYTVHPINRLHPFESRTEIKYIHYCC